jgi:murein DD-endopeptidase MepM/ murein hydrolase activator NlpD
MQRSRHWANPKSLGILGTLLVALCLLGPLAADASASKLSDARNELAAARSQLNKLQAELDTLAREYATAEARLYEIDNAIEAAEKDEQRSRQDLDQMRTQLSDRIVHLYKDGRNPVPAFLEVLFDTGDFTKVVERFGLLNKVAAQDQNTLGQVEAHLDRVVVLQAELEGMRVEQETQVQQLTAARQKMETRMKASASEYNRLKTRVATLEEAARKAAEAEKARARAAASASRGSAAAARGFVFPVRGPHSYINDWGFARSGGRRHKGTDIMAARGTPVVAVVSGRVRRTAYDVGLGGTTIWLNGNNGTSYYYAHLNSIAGGVRAGTSVQAGQVIGTVGNSGNARGGSPHLHFEIHPGGGGAINPYYILRAAD